MGGAFARFLLFPSGNVFHVVGGAVATTWEVERKAKAESDFSMLLTSNKNKILKHPFNQSI
jgi:hypothetical protein